MTEQSSHWRNYKCVGVRGQKLLEASACRYQRAKNCTAFLGQNQVGDGNPWKCVAFSLGTFADSQIGEQKTKWFF